MTFHIGLIGGGNITETHARAARAIPGVEISAINGTNAEKIARLCCEHGGTPYQDFAAFLKHRPLDLVIIGSPSDRKSTRLNSSHGYISYAVFCLKKKTLHTSTPSLTYLRVRFCIVLYVCL